MKYICTINEDGLEEIFTGEDSPLAEIENRIKKLELLE